MVTLEMGLIDAHRILSGLRDYTKRLRRTLPAEQHLPREIAALEKRIETAMEEAREDARGNDTVPV